MFERGFPGQHRSQESQTATAPPRTEHDLTPEEIVEATEGLGGFNNIAPKGFRIEGAHFVPVEPHVGKGLDGWLRTHFPDLEDYTT